MNVVRSNWSNCWLASKSSKLNIVGIRICQFSAAIIVFPSFIGLFTYSGALCFNISTVLFNKTVENVFKKSLVNFDKIQGFDQKSLRICGKKVYLFHHFFKKKSKIFQKITYSDKSCVLFSDFSKFYPLGGAPFYQIGKK